MTTKIYANARFGFREDTLENWTKENPILEKGEPAIVRDGENGEWLKIGDGKTVFNDLPWKYKNGVSQEELQEQLSGVWSAVSGIGEQSNIASETASSALSMANDALNVVSAASGRAEEAISMAASAQNAAQEASDLAVGAKSEIEQIKHRHVQDFYDGDTITLADGVEYQACMPISTLTINYPQTEYFISVVKVICAEEGTVTINYPSGTTFIGGKPEMKAGEFWELNIMDGVVVGGKRQ